MAQYTRIAVFGATGRVGREVTQALVENGFDVVPISRQETTVAGIQTQKLGSLKTFDAVVSTVGLSGKAAQLDLIQQAKSEGVKRFVASEYGVHPDTGAGRSDFFAAKREMRQQLHDTGFPDGWTAIASGFFDDILPTLVSADRDAGSITLKGSGQVRHPFTLRHDIGRVLAATFKQPEQYKNTWVTVTNAWYTLDEVAQKIIEITGKSWEVNKVPTDMKAPILHLAEHNGWDIIPPGSGQNDVPVELGNFEEVAIKKYAKLLI